MRIKSQNSRVTTIPWWIGLLLVVFGLLVPWRANAVGSWTNLNNKPLSGRGGMSPMLLLTDGTVMCQFFGGTNWYLLTPDIRGSYVNGNWTTLPLMVGGNRQFYSSDVLRDGRLFVAGAEYGANPAGGDSGSTAEVYDPVANTWTLIPVPNGLINPISSDTLNGGFRDSQSIILPDGTVMIAPVFPIVSNGTVIFNPTFNSLSAGPAALGNQNEVCWVKLPDGSILTIDTSTTSSERFIPSLNQWIRDANLPVQLYSANSELGPGFLLADGRVFFLGGTGATAFYTPSGNTNNGAWTQGPNIPSGMVARDTPAAMMVNGKILCAVTPGTNSSDYPVYFYEFDPATTNFTQRNGPSGGAASVNNIISDYYGMLALPDGKILVSDVSAPGNQGAQLYVYTPDGTPLPAGKPTISSITANGDGSYHLTGTRLNGISQGAAYGDDMQVDSNYPLVRLTDGSGNVYYARTYNWSSTGVMTGNSPVTTEFSLPLRVYGNGGPFSLVAVANGISSDPVAFALPPPNVWVDFNYVGFLEVGSFSFPDKTLAKGVTDVPSGGTIAIKPGSSTEILRINKPMTIMAIGGSAAVGHGH